MIGVVAKENERDYVQEYFELFKTPWEYAEPGQPYDVLLISTDPVVSLNEYLADLVLIYSSSQLELDLDIGTCPSRVAGSRAIKLSGQSIPVYGDLSRFDASPPWEGMADGGNQPEVIRRTVDDCSWVRFGWDLFREVEFLFKEGQPLAHAASPTLDLHIDSMRREILGAGIPLVEVLPRPEGFGFICCLTHDIDFYGLRRHRFDSTFWGFFYRATVGSLLGVVSGRRSFKELWTNLKTVVSLPLVYVGALPDPWRPFDDYLSLEAGLNPTFFLVPFKDYGGHSPEGREMRKRAVAHDVGDLGRELSRFNGTRFEIGLHGLNAWRDAESGRRESKRIEEGAGRYPNGVRMHWLYFDQNSPVKLEKAGFEFDSTLGYNHAVGYRAGTGQVFKLPRTRALLELPLSLQDTALFFPDRMGLTKSEAKQVCLQLLSDARERGGSVTVNWHDRSLGPERLWGDFYLWLLEQVKQSGAWFATCSDAVEWFCRRRDISFQVGSDGITVELKPGSKESTVPNLVVREYRKSIGSPEEVPSFKDHPYDGNGPLRLNLN